jgi:hypothetical protein
VRPGVQRRRGAAAIFIVLVALVPASILLLRWFPSGEPIFPPNWLRVPLMAVWQIAMALFGIPVVSGRKLGESARSFVVWVGVSLIAFGCARPATWPGLLCVGGIVWLLGLLVARFQAQSSEPAVRNTYGHCYVINALGLLTLAGSPQDLASMLPISAAAWVVITRSRTRAFLRACFVVLERHRLPCAIVFSGSSILLLAVSIFGRIFVHSNSSKPDSGFQPYMLTTMLAIAGTALRVGPNRAFTRIDWLSVIAFCVFMSLLDMGSLIIYLSTLLSFSFLAGVRSRDLRQLVKWSAAGGILVVVLSAPGLPERLAASGVSQRSAVLRFVSHFDHVRLRLDDATGGRPIDELTRMRAALRATPVVGFGQARTWIVAKASRKDYALGVVIILIGWIGLGWVLILYGGLFRSMLQLCVKNRSGLEAVGLAVLALALLVIIQAIIPMASSTELTIISIGVPQAFLARGGSSLAVCLGCIACLSVLGQDYGEERQNQSEHL